ncbi:CHAT domain-containing protein [Streptomyces griseoruber]|uniref:CHAT domain-containing protein n=1 Tax=Streptomyces griseoruber TaxID=1943 RepID=UPI0037A75E1C
MRTGDPSHVQGDQVHLLICRLLVADTDDADSRLITSLLAARGLHVKTPEERLLHGLQQSEITLLRLGVPPEEVAAQMMESIIEFHEALLRAQEEGTQPQEALPAKDPPLPPRSGEYDRFLDDLTVTAAENLVADMPVGHPDRPARLQQHSTALRRRFEAHGTREDLDRAIDVAREGAAGTSTASPQRARSLSALAEALRVRFQIASDPRDLDEAVLHAREASEMAEPGSPEAISAYSQLDIALLLRHERTGDSTDLDDAERFARGALDLAGDDHPERSILLSTLAAVLKARYHRVNDQADLDETLGLAKEAVQRCPRVPPIWSRRLSALAWVLTTRYEVTGDIADLQEAIRTSRAAVHDCPREHPEFPPHLFNLGTALYMRYRRNGAAADLDEAVRSCREAVDGTPQGHMYRSGFQAHLAIILRARYQETEAEEDLAAAITAAEDAVQGIAESDTRWAWTVSLLSLLRGGQYRRTQDPADFAEAVRLGQAAVAATPVEERYRVTVVNNLVTVLNLGPEDDQLTALAIELARESARYDALADETRQNLAVALLRHAQRTGDTALRDEASASFRAASEVATAPADLRLTAALGWASLEIERRDWAAATTAATAAVRLLPLLAWRGLPRRDQERRLIEIPDVARVAAACAVSAGQPETAVNVLEQGRGLLLAQTLETRTDTTELAAAHPELAQRLEDVRRALDALPTETAPGLPDGAPTAPSDRSKDADLRQRLATEWDELIARIRALDGFQDFLRPLDLPRMRRAASAGPLVYLNVSELRSDALIITEAGVRAVPLPEITPDALYDNVADFLSVTALGDPSSTSARTLLREVLAWLWEAVARPVLDALGQGSSAQPLPRVWWLPTGLLSFLPLHAAGADGDSVLDRVVSSYAPTIRALEHARSQPRADAPLPPIVVALPEQGLPNARREVLAIGRRFPDARQFVDPDATRTAVLEALQGCFAVHFACHGAQGIGSPSTAALQLHDGQLSMTDLSRIRLDQAEFAFLSACHTARPGLVLQEEAVHLAGALQMAGFRHVIGTLWAVRDPIAATVSEQVYDRLAASGRLSTHRTAHALHEAVRRIREAAPDQPQLWASHIHLGP